MARTRGTLSCFKSGCAHPECRQADRDYDRERKRRLAAGRPTTNLIDAEPARTHARRLLNLGWDRRTLSAHVGTEIDALVYGKPATGLPPLRRTSDLTAQRILAIPPVLVATDKRICADGSRRRAQALCLLGHTITWQAQQTGLARAVISRIVNGTSRQVAARRALAIRDLHEQWWNTPAAPSPEASLARTTATAKGYLPTGAYDDEHLDLPDHELAAAIAAQVAAMTPADLASAHYAYDRLGDRTPLTVAAHRAHRRAKEAAKRRREDTAGRYQTAA